MGSPLMNFADLQVTKQRKRGDTLSLLPDPIGPTDDEHGTPPMPEESLRGYTKERLQKGLVYAEKCLARRDISPRAEFAIDMYREELEDALKARTRAERREHLLIVQAEETLLRDRWFLRPPEKPEKIEIQDQMLKLKEFQYIIRYGHYAKIIPNRLQIHANPIPSEIWTTISGQHRWTVIANAIREEAEAYEKSKGPGQSVGTVTQPIRVAVYMACIDLGLSEDLIYWALDQYGDRNSAVHRTLEEAKALGNPTLFAKILCADRDDLDATFSIIKSETDIGHLRTIINQEIEENFENADDHPSTPERWFPSESFKQFVSDAAAKAKKPSKGKEKKASIQKAEEKSAEKAARQKKASMASASLAASPSKIGQKRLASTEESRRSEQEQSQGIKRQRCKLRALKYKLEGDGGVRMVSSLQ